MARGARLSFFLARFGALLAAVAVGQAVHGAGGGQDELARFLGVWTFRAGSRVQAECVGMGNVLDGIDGTKASIYRGTETDLVFDLGCHCAIGLHVEGNRATMTGQQRCSVFNRGVMTTGDLTAVSLELADDGTLSVSLSGDRGQLATSVFGCALRAFSGAGTVARVGDGKVSCGSPDTAVGIIPAGPAGAVNCPLGAGLEGLRIQTSDESSGPCSDATGGHGEGRWVLPDDHRAATPICNVSHTTVLSFCRVDGARLRPMTTSADLSRYYAVLKLGTTCPNGSVEVSKTIDNEDRPDPTDRSNVVGDLGGNQVLADPAFGTIARLTFCYFRTASSADGVMTAFPDFGIPYAVFHRHAGEQPPWVLLRRWQFSNDEDGQTGINKYDASDETVIREFEEVIENGNQNTMYNYARVR